MADYTVTFGIDNMETLPAEGVTLVAHITNNPVLQAKLGFSSDKVVASVNGSPATPNTQLKAGDKVTLEPAAGSKA